MAATKAITRNTESNRMDSWMNVLTKLNTAHDKRRGASWRREWMSDFDCEELYAGSALAARAIELPTKIQLRNGFKVQFPNLDQAAELESMVEKVDATDDQVHEASEKMAALIDELGVVAAVIEAKSWARAYGGSALLMGLDDGQSDLRKPVRWQTLKGVRYLVTLRPRECWPTQWNTNPLSGGYGMPVVYQVRRETQGGVPTGSGFEVHHSRLVRFDGVRVSRRHTAENRGWGRSIMERWATTLRDFDTSYATIPVLLQDFSQLVMMMEGLAEAIGAGEADVVAQRIEQVNLGRSIIGGIVVDSKDKVERQQTPVSGLAELLDRMSNRLAADVDMPAAILFGQSPSGLNATGDPNTRWYYDSLAGDRPLSLTPKLNQIVKALFLSSDGPTQGKEPARWSIHYGEMWLPTPAEVAEIRYKTAQTDSLMITSGVLMPEEVATSRYGGDTWSAETHLDEETRDAMANADPLVDPNADPNAEPDPNAPPPPPAAPPVVRPKVKKKAPPKAE